MVEKDPVEDVKEVRVGVMKVKMVEMKWWIEEVIGGRLIRHQRHTCNVALKAPVEFPSSFSGHLCIFYPLYTYPHSFRNCDYRLTRCR